MEKENNVIGNHYEPNRGKLSNIDKRLFIFPTFEVSVADKLLQGHPGLPKQFRGKK